MTYPPEPHVFLNGQFIPRSQATFDVEDRGAIFADGIYEVVRYFFGKPHALEPHMARLRRSLAAIRIPLSPDAARLPEISQELMARNKLTEAKAYWQISRGAAPRGHEFPRNATPTVLAMLTPLEPVDPAAPPKQVKAIVLPDERWHHCWIKSLMLLPNVLAKNTAAENGALEAILHRDGIVTEGTSTSLFIARGREYWTHPADRWILGGITRLVLLDMAGRNHIPVVERTFTLEELRSADEVFICGTTAHVAAVTHIDSRPIGAGVAGPMAIKMQRLLMDHVMQTCGV